MPPDRRTEYHPGSETSLQKNIKPDSDRASDLTINSQQIQKAGNQATQQRGDGIKCRL